MLIKIMILFMLIILIHHKILKIILKQNLYIFIYL